MLLGRLQQLKDAKDRNALWVIGGLILTGWLLSTQESEETEA